MKKIITEVMTICKSQRTFFIASYITVKRGFPWARTVCDFISALGKANLKEKDVNISEHSLLVLIRNFKHTISFNHQTNPVKIRTVMVATQMSKMSSRDGLTQWISYKHNLKVSYYYLVLFSPWYFLSLTQYNKNVVFCSFMN